jgi:ribosome-binding protein aMBF1 (putative translation factor)
VLEKVQIRMARAALGWSAKKLAAKAGLAHNTVARFEVGRDALFETVTQLEKALEKGGVIFIPRDANGGPGVRLKR